MNETTIAMLSVSLSHTMSMPGKSLGAVPQDGRPQTDAVHAPEASGRLRRLRTWIGM